MAFDEERSLIIIGSKNKSSAVTLPCSWIRFWKLKKKQKIRILGDGVLVLFPSNYPNLDQARELTSRILMGVNNGKSEA